MTWGIRWEVSVLRPHRLVLCALAGVLLPLIAWHPDHRRLIGQSFENRLSHPPGGVGNEFDLFAMIVPRRGMNESDIPFVEEVLEWKTHSLVLTGNLYHESEVRDDELVHPLASTTGNTLADLQFFFLAQERISSDV